MALVLAVPALSMPGQGRGWAWWLVIRTRVDPRPPQALRQNSRSMGCEASPGRVCHPGPDKFALLASVNKFDKKAAERSLGACAGLLRRRTLRDCCEQAGYRR